MKLHELEVGLGEMEQKAQAAEAAGLETVAKQLREKISRVRRGAQAYEHHRYVTAEQIQSFQERLQASTSRLATQEDKVRLGRDGYYVSEVHDELAFVTLGSYDKLPPDSVMADVKKAQDRKLFDSFEVCFVQPVATLKPIPDPIVFGRIHGVPDRFFIAEWDDDVKFNDIVGKHGG